jgi:hypothetical protein
MHLPAMCTAHPCTAAELAVHLATARNGMEAATLPGLRPGVRKLMPQRVYLPCGAAAMPHQIGGAGPAAVHADPARCAQQALCNRRRTRAGTSFTIGLQLESALFKRMCAISCCVALKTAKNLTVDGEMVAFEALLLQVHPGVLRVVTAASA